jgi:hypothetical protein
MNLFTQDEIDRITKAKETNDKLEEYFNDKRVEWSKNVDPLFKSLSLDLSNPVNSKTILDTQAIALSYRQMLNEQINFFLNKRSREMTKIKKLKQDKFIFYATGFGVKTNMGEKGILIDGHLAENDRALEIIEAYISYMRDTVKNLESLGFAVKNMIELMNYLGK